MSNEKTLRATTDVLGTPCSKRSPKKHGVPPSTNPWHQIDTYHVLCWACEANLNEEKFDKALDTLSTIKGLLDSKRWEGIPMRVVAKMVDDELHLELEYYVCRSLIGNPRKRLYTLIAKPGVWHVHTKLAPNEEATFRLIPPKGIKRFLGELKTDLRKNYVLEK